MDGFERYVKQISKKMKQMIRPKLKATDNSIAVTLIDRLDESIHDKKVYEAIVQERKDNLFNFVNKLSSETINEVRAELELEEVEGKDIKKSSLVEELYRMLFEG